MITSFATKTFLKTLESLNGGHLRLICGGRSYEFGDRDSTLRATVLVHRNDFFRRALFDGDVGAGEAWMNGDWSSPDLVSVIRLAIRNLVRLESSNSFLSALSRAADRVRHRLRPNSLAGSRRNISEHYDLSNEFFQLFLDPSMMYSCTLYQSPSDSLQQAQWNKLDRICRRLQLKPGDHVLEIGTGWGAFAEHAVRHYGCRVTTTTISRRQFEYAAERFDSFEDGARIELLFEDYRKLRGQYDKIVSIEMFEAVGLDYYDQFFGACDKLLKPDGAMLLQTITINDRTFPAYRGRADWIQKYIFPGSELASLSEILRSLARCTSLNLHHAEDIGTHYARTLAAWRVNFHQAHRQVRALGFDDRFLRMWDYYFAYCEAAFLERHIGDAQLLLAKPACRTLFNEPWVSTHKRTLAAATG